MDRSSLRSIDPRSTVVALSFVTAALVTGCGPSETLDPNDPARGPGQLVGNGDPVSDGQFEGGNDPDPEARDVEFVEDVCDLECRSYCDGLSLENPVNRGVCSKLWGIGIDNEPVDRKQACRRLFVDMIGRFPTPGEVNDVCNLPTWGETVDNLLARDEFVFVNQRRWADEFLYNNRTVNFERAYDMDDLVGKAYRGLVAWDQFAQVASAHPVFVRRYDNGSDRVSALFKIFMGRPPYENERADLARLYTVWENDYWEHPYAGLMPDAYIAHRCLDEEGNATPESAGPCTSILFGINQVVIKPDGRRNPDGLTWSGYLSADEWELLQAPGRVITTDPALSQRFWEWTADQVAEQYLGYDLGTVAPEARRELVQYAIDHGGDIRALHYAVATSLPYLQSSRDGGWDEDDALPAFAYGPLKQIEVEPWLDSIKRFTGYQMAACDHRLPFPEDYLDEDLANGWTRAFVRMSKWTINQQNDGIVTDYRTLAQTLGGCPTNEVNSRFTTVSILNTAVQENFIARVCNAGNQPDVNGVPATMLLPEGMSSSAALTEDAALEIATRQSRLFLSRDLTSEERDLVLEAYGQCEPKPCDAEAFARPLCFALLSSAEMLFY